MKVIKQGEKANVFTKVEGDVATVQHVTLNKPQDTSYELTWNFDFKDVSREDLVRLAVRGLVIDQRPKFKAEKDSKKLATWDNKSFDVKDLLAKERIRVSQEEKARKAIETLDADKQIEMLKALLAAKGVEV